MTSRQVYCRECNRYYPYSKPMKRVYLREVVDGKQRFVPLGYYCQECGFMIPDARLELQGWKEKVSIYPK